MGKGKPSKHTCKANKDSVVTTNKEARGAKADAKAEEASAEETIEAAEVVVPEVADQAKVEDQDREAIRTPGTQLPNWVDWSKTERSTPSKRYSDTPSPLRSHRLSTIWLRRTVTP